MEISKDDRETERKERDWRERDRLFMTIGKRKVSTCVRKK